MFFIPRRILKGVLYSGVIRNLVGKICAYPCIHILQKLPCAINNALRLRAAEPGGITLRESWESSCPKSKS